VSADYRPEAEVVQLCQELIRIDTSNFGSDPGPGERDAAERVAELLDEVGIQSQLMEPEPRRTSVVARWEPDGVDRSLSPLLIHGHLESVQHPERAVLRRCAGVGCRRSGCMICGMV
jgi:acetylornithine deacetylase/succinyl-diaminopimelate desuccinylase-like protein